MTQDPADPTLAPDDWAAPRGGRWRRGKGVRMLDNPWFSVTRFAQAVAPTGAAADYHVINFKARAVGVLALHPDGTVTLVGQDRFALQAYSWELPEGGVPYSEDLLQGAMRELREETGLVAATWRPILEMNLSNASSDEYARGYLATDLSQVGADPDPTESLALARPRFRQALAMATDGRIRDSITVAMLLRAYHMAREGELDADIARAMLD